MEEKRLKRIAVFTGTKYKRYLKWLKPGTGVYKFLCEECKFPVKDAIAIEGWSINAQPGIIYDLKYKNMSLEVVNIKTNSVAS